MDSDICGSELADALCAEILALCPHRLPDDIAIYRRAVAALLAAVPTTRARAAADRARALGGLPSRAEVALFCAQSPAQG